jgi:2,3-bisphosphoglycerate-dependent phosphoglycerate mutase
MATLVMMRHGESEWNKENRFCGWIDIPLSLQGLQESFETGRKLAEIAFDIVFTSSFIRTQMAAILALSVSKHRKTPRLIHPYDQRLQEWDKIYDQEAEAECIPFIVSWQLNERIYGQLQGLNKQAAANRFGKEQVQLWRRGFDTLPPGGESLAMTAERVLPYFKETIVPLLMRGKNVLISAHGNSLRAIIMYLDGLSKEQIVKLEIATGEQMIYQFDEKGNWRKQESFC